MQETILYWIEDIPVELATALLAMLPITELRASLPVAITVFGLDPLTALIYSLIGNAVPLLFIFWLLPPLLRYTEKNSVTFHKIMEKYFSYLRSKHEKRYQVYGRIILFFLVAIPLPGTGVWTASLLAVLFGVKPRYAIGAILSGMGLAGLIVLSITQGLISSVSLGL